MKNSILLTALLIASVTSTIVLGSGGEGGSAGGTGSEGNKIGRGIASADAPEVVEDAENFGMNCLASLDSKFKGKSSDADFKTKLDGAIKNALSQKMKDRSVASVNSIHYPECYAYARETKDEVLKSWLVKKPVAEAGDDKVVHPSTTSK